MGLVGLIVLLLVSGAAWWWRAQSLGQAASSALDLAGRAKGAYSRSRFRTKAGGSVLAGVSDAGTAAAILLYSLAALKRPVVLSDEDKIDEQLEMICRMDRKARDEAMAFAAWAASQVADTSEIVRRFTPLWMQTLKEETNRRELVKMAEAVGAIGGAATDAQLAVIGRLSDGLFPKT